MFGRRRAAVQLNTVNNCPGGLVLMCPVSWKPKHECFSILVESMQDDFSMHSQFLTGKNGILKQIGSVEIV